MAAPQLTDGTKVGEIVLRGCRPSVLEEKNQEPSYAYRKQTCGCFRRCAFRGIRIASLGATGRKSTATLDRSWRRAE
jgi:hypothetical protein